MEAFLNDLRVAVRRLIRQPLFTAIAILTLAIGIGANSAIFTLVNSVLLRPLPFHEPSELVWVRGNGQQGVSDVLSFPILMKLQEQNRAFAAVAGFSDGAATLTGMGDAEQIEGTHVTAGYFDVIGVKPILGSVLPPDANQPGKSNVIVLSEGLWREKFGADQDIVGRSIILNGTPRIITGVMPQSALLPKQSRYWAPIENDEAFTAPRNVFAMWLTIIGRTRPDATKEQADAAVAAAVDQAELAADRENSPFTGMTVPLQELVSGDARMPLLVLLGAVGLVLLIACANLANLLLAQAAARSTDFAVRRALGASPWRLVRQLATESLALSLVGGAAGLLLGAWAADALVSLLPPDMPQLDSLSLDWTVLLFTGGISLGAALIFGLAPAMHVRQGALSEMLREGGRGLVSRGSIRTRAALVVAESALAFSLVIGAGLLIRSLDNLTEVDPGFRADNTLAFELSLPDARYPTDAQRTLFFEQLLQRVDALPNVLATGAIMNLPLGGSNTMVTFTIDGQPAADPENPNVMDVRVASPGYFETMSIPIRRGRTFDARDRAGAVPVALISESAAAKFFPGQDPIGRNVEMGWRVNGERVTGQVIGIVGGIRQRNLRETAAPEIYFPLAQVAQSDMVITVHTAGNPAAMSNEFRDAVAQMDASLAVANMKPMAEFMNAAVASERFITMLLSVFSAIALLLAAVGIFGVISYGVAQRRREFGVRMAVGADRSEIMALVLRGAVRLAAAGLVIGAIAAFALTRVLESLLFDVKPTDPLTYIAAAVGLVTVAVAASALPAWSASRLPPSAVLNTET